MKNLSQMSPQFRKAYNLLVERKGALTRVTAMHYGIMNLTARITELRQAGYRIVCTNKKDGFGNRYGEFTYAPLMLPAPSSLPLTPGMQSVI